MLKKTPQNKLEASLIIKAQQGNSHALNALIASCYIRLLHGAYPLTNNKDDAKDVVQEALISAWTEPNKTLLNKG